MPTLLDVCGGRSHISYKIKVWLKSIKACGSWSKMLTLIHNRQQQQTTADNAIPTIYRAGDTKMANGKEKIKERRRKKESFIP